MTVGDASEALVLAIEAAERLGLDTQEARGVASTIAEREGYPADLYVLALVGGTGVGKSSLLNALAGRTVSPAGVRRPTTSTPVAWVPADRQADIRPLLEWLGGAEIRGATGATEVGATEGVAIVDLPDLDSIEPAHAAGVDAALPRVDAVLWVTDPEKYDDAILHDGYLRRWMPRLARQAIVVNKTDRLTPSDAGRVREDLAARLRSEGLPEVPVLIASAVRDVETVATWLADGAAAKEVVRARLRAATADAVASLASAAGVEGASEPAPLVSREAREGAVGAASGAIIDLIDLAGLRRQAIAATRAAARPVGGGPVGLVRSLLERGSGMTERQADPEGHLRRWRERGSIDRAVAAVRGALMADLSAAPPRLRPRLMAVADPMPLGADLSRAIDGVVTGTAARFDVPSSRLWALLGVAQLAGTAVVVAGLIWLAVLFAVGDTGSTPSVEVPLLGMMPTPGALLIAGLATWFLLGRFLRWHAGRLGGRWADRLAEEVRRGVARVVEGTVREPLLAQDDARLTLWRAARSLSPSSGPARP